MVTTCKLFVVDDHATVRKGLRMLIEREEGMDVVGEAASAEEALAVIPDTNPDVVLVDLSMDGMDGMELTSRLKDLDPGLRVLIVTTHEGSSIVDRAVEAGADGYVSKSNISDKLVSAVRVAVEGNSFFS